MRSCVVPVHHKYLTITLLAIGYHTKKISQSGRIVYFHSSLSLPTLRKLVPARISVTKTRSLIPEALKYMHTDIGDWNLSGLCRLQKTSDKELSATQDYSDDDFHFVAKAKISTD